MDEQNEFENSQESHEELDLDLEDDQGDTLETAQDDVEAIKKRNADLEAKNKQLYARLKKQAPAEKPKLKTEELGETGTRLSKLELLESKRQFAWENNLSPEETDKVFAITGNKPTKDVLKDPFIQAGLEGVRALKRVAEATPSPSGRAKSYNGKSFDELSNDEQKQNYSDHVASLLKRK